MKLQYIAGVLLLSSCASHAAAPTRHKDIVAEAQQKRFDAVENKTRETAERVKSLRGQIGEGSVADRMNALQEAFNERLAENQAYLLGLIEQVKAAGVSRDDMIAALQGQIAQERDARLLSVQAQGDRVSALEKEMADLRAVAAHATAQCSSRTNAQALNRVHERLTQLEGSGSSGAASPAVSAAPMSFTSDSQYADRMAELKQKQARNELFLETFQRRAEDFEKELQRRTEDFEKEFQRRTEDFEKEFQRRADNLENEIKQIQTLQDHLLEKLTQLPAGQGSQSEVAAKTIHEELAELAQEMKDAKRSLQEVKSSDLVAQHEMVMHQLGDSQGDAALVSIENALTMIRFSKGLETRAEDVVEYWKQRITEKNAQKKIARWFRKNRKEKFTVDIEAL